MENLQADIQLIHMLLARLEHISADSYWAHRASGVRGALLMILDRFENGQPIRISEIKLATDLGFYILTRAATEKAPVRASLST
jgi:hypothetical protein